MYIKGYYLKPIFYTLLTGCINPRFSRVRQLPMAAPSAVLNFTPVRVMCWRISSMQKPRRETTSWAMIERPRPIIGWMRVCNQQRYQTLFRILPRVLLNSPFATGRCQLRNPGDKALKIRLHRASLNSAAQLRRSSPQLVIMTYMHDCHTITGTYITVAHPDTGSTRVLS